MITEAAIKEFCQAHTTHIFISGDNLFADCPYCGKSDKHWNISLQTGKHHCYRCGWGGSFESLIKHVKGYHTEVESVIEEYNSKITLATLASIYNQEETPQVLFDWKANTKPLTANCMQCKRALEYLNGRNISLELATSLEMLVGVSGKYENMIIIPIKHDGKVVNFVGRRFYGSGRRYDGPHNNEALMNKSHLLFNYDNVKDSNYLVIVEGIFDAIALMQMNIPVVALMGKEISVEQVTLVMKWNKIVVLLDGGFLKDALKVAHSLEGLTEDVQLAIMQPDQDPADFPIKAVKAIENAASIDCW